MKNTTRQIFYWIGIAVIFLFLIISTNINRRTKNEKLQNNLDKIARMQLKTRMNRKKQGRSFLYAIKTGDITLVKKMLKEGMSPNFQNFDDTALRTAIINNHTAIVKLLLAKGANPAFKTMMGYTLLQTAEVKGNQKIISMLKRALSQQKKKN